MRVEIATAVYGSRIATGQSLKCLRQTTSFRYGCPVDQDRNDWDVAVKSGFNLDANPIVLICNPQAPAWVLTKPAWTDDGEQRVASAQGILDVLMKVDPKRDAINVHEHALGSIMLD